MEQDYTFHEYDSSINLGVKQHNNFCICGECTNIGLWGPTLSGASCSLEKPNNMYHSPDDGVSYDEDFPVNLDSSGRRNYIENKTKKKEEPDMEKVTWVEQAIIATIKIVNLNLISLGKRMRQAADKNPLRNSIILQSEVVSLFKGNFIRLLKQQFSPREISVIKTSITYNIRIDINDTISLVGFTWEGDRENYHYLRAIMTKAFFSTVEYQFLSKAALDEWNEKNPLIHAPAKTIYDVNFDSIKKIKF